MTYLKSDIPSDDEEAWNELMLTTDVSAMMKNLFDRKIANEFAAVIVTTMMCLL